MPSRAVLRKKARRDTKRRKEDASPLAKPAVYYNGNTEHLRVPQPAQGSHANTEYYRNDTGATVVPARFQVPPPAPRPPKAVRPRVVVKPPRAKRELAEGEGPEGGSDGEAEREPAGDREVGADVSAEGLTHKQRKKLQTKLRLEKQMARLEENAARAAAAAPPPVAVPPSGDGEEEAAENSQGLDASPVTGEEGDDKEAPPTRGPVVPEGPKERHDPRFTNGTFWRDRKERRGRTLFLGGVPAHFTVQNVKELVATVVDTDPGAVEYLVQLPPGTAIVEEVDMLSDKHGAKVRHMYVTMASVPIAFIASRKLDGMRMSHHSLRCNFASDKTQRAEAIKRRGPEVSGGRGGRGFGGGLGRGGGRGFGRGSDRGGGRGFGRGFGRGAMGAPMSRDLGHAGGGNAEE